MGLLRILIVDDHEAVRHGVRSLLSSRAEWSVCGEAGDGIEAIEKARQLRPAIVLMDINLPRMDGLEATRIIKREIPECNVIIVTQNHPTIAREQARSVDAKASVTKSDLTRDLIPAIEMVFGDAKSEARTESIAEGEGWVRAGGALAKLVQEFDWTETPLGSSEEWPQSLKTVVRVMLTSRFAMWMSWGPDLTFLYNDAYAKMTLGKKHPWALGKPSQKVWEEIWDDIGPRIQRVLDTGEATWDEALLLFLERSGYREETYHTFSYSPLSGDDGKIAGHLCVVTEETDRVIGERRLKTLRSLATELSKTITEEDVVSSLSRSLLENEQDLPFTLTYLLSEDGRTARLACRTGITAGHPAAPEMIELTEENQTWPMSDLLSGKDSVVVEDLAERFGSLPTGAWDSPPNRALLLPMTSQAQTTPAGIIVIGLNPYRPLDVSYAGSLNLIAGQIAASIANARAYEDEKKRAEALAEIDRAKTTFFSNVSHEFRTPLTLMLGPVEDLLAKSHTGLSPAAKSQLELVNRNGSRLLRLVNTLLDFSRIEAGRMQAIYQPTDLAAFTVELASVFRSATEKAGLQLELDCPKLDEPVFVDRGMWEKIVLNLISNAFKFTFEGSITVALTRAGTNAELRVRDTGVGIPANEIPRLFDRFHRIENTRSRTHEGSGIGLALVLELVKLHGGSVAVESVPGEGTTFIVSVPLGSAHLAADRIGGSRSLASTALGAAPFVEEALRWLPDATDREPQEQVLPGDELLPVPCPPMANGKSTSERPYVLVADDNSDMRQYLVRLLGERYEVRAVADGQLALAAVRDRSPNLVLTDVMMPNLDGFGLLHELRSDPKTRTIPVIVLSARAGEESRVEGMEHGADDYLIKPFSARELLARVQTHIEMSRVRKQAAEALRQRTEQFETLLNGAPLGVYLVDADFRIREVNPPALEHFGNVPNLIGRSLDEVMRILWPKGYADEIVRRFRHTLETGEPYVVPEWTETRRDRGAIEFYEWRINRIPLPDGTNGVVCYFRDISRQVHARQAIAQSAKLLRVATEAAELGIWHWCPDEDRVLWENDRPYEIFGRNREEGPIAEAEFKEKFCHPDDLPAYEEAVARSLETGGRLFYQGRIYRTDGTCGWVEFTAQVESGSDGLPLRLLGTVQDITERKEAEEALRQSEDRLRLAQKVGHSGTWESTETGEIITSPELRELFGLDLESASRDPELWRRMISREDLATMDRALADAIATKGEFRAEFRITRADGLERWIETTAKIFFAEGGKLERIIGVSTDITERKRSDDILRQHRERFDLVAEAAQVGFWFCDLPFDKLIWDNLVKEHFWLPPEADVTIDTFYERLHPDDRERTRQAIAHSNANDAPYDIEYRTLSTDGQQKWVRALGRTFYDAAGQPKRFDGVTLDITERKRIEDRERAMTAEAVAATAKFRAVFEQTPVFAGIMALDGTVMDANQLSLEACGYRSEDVVGHVFCDTGWWRHSKDVQAKIRAATVQAAQGTPYRETLTYHWADDTERLVDFALHPIRDGKDQILFLHPTGVDITDLKRAEEKYRTLAETLDAEVRVRTTEVVQQSEQLRELSNRLLQTQDDERRHIARELHDSAGQIIAALGMSLASLTRYSTNNPVFGKALDDSQSLVQQLSKEIRTTSYLLHPPLLDENGLAEAIPWYMHGLMERSGLSIDLGIEENFGRLPSEMELALFRIVQESLTNIHRHSGSKTAMVRLSRNNGNVVLEIQDEGKGIPAEKLEGIRAQRSGVGITGMRERVRHFKGEMDIESNRKGTKIVVKLPIHATSRPDSENVLQEQGSGTAG